MTVPLSTGDQSGTSAAPPVGGQHEMDVEARPTGADANSEGPTGRPTPSQATPTRLSATWTAVVVASVLMIALVTFVAQNTQRSSINFLWLHGRAPTAVVLLIAAIAGALIVAAVGVARLVQVHRAEHQRTRTTDGDVGTVGG